LGLGGGRAADKTPLQPILQASRRVRSRSRRDISAILLRFIEDFSAYRRDFQLYLAAQEAVSKIRLLYDEREIITARMNHRLYEFPTPDEVAVSAEAVAGHVILKADLRGSTLITEQLVSRGLNPATYFSRNFYEPITALTSHYHGEKIFLEGDAMILMFLETVDPRSERLAVASACGLAVRLLEMLARGNEINASYALPPLEIGIGIAYQTGSPTYVFDGTTRIVISPAINRADRLSSSAAGLRKHIAPLPHAPRVAVFKALNGGDDTDGKQPQEQIYNVDGVALEPAAFAQLAEELPLRRILDVADDFGDGEWYATPWPFHTDKNRQMVIRRALVRDLNETPEQKSDLLQACYCEVIAAPTLLEVLERSRLGEPLSASSVLKSASLP
jgi:class 3 adenylate cyclase